MKKYLDLDGLEKVAEKVNEKTPTVDALPVSASVGDIVIFSSDGGIYRYDGAQWVKTTGDADAAPMLSITWGALRSLRNSGSLIPGMQYRITDFVTTTAQADTRSAGHAFDVIVTADDTCTLNENARACVHEGDSYFSDSNLKAWKLKYCFSNDVSRFAWADTSNGKGVIYRLIDEFNNDFPYDFKNIQFKRYKASGHIYRYSTSDARYNQISKDWKSNFSNGTISTSNLPFYYPVAPVTTISGTWYDENGNAVDASTLGTVINILDESPNLVLGRTDDFKYFYTFSTLVSVDAEPYDTTINVLKNIYSNFYDICKNNFVLTLPNIVFFGANCYSNTFGASCNSNTFGASCHSNTFGAYYRYNHIEDGCYYLNFSNSGISSSYIQKARVFAGTQGQSDSNKMQVALTRGWVIPYNVKQTGTGTCSISAA